MPEQLEMRVLIGLPGSGKTNYAHNLMQDQPGRWTRISWDELRRTMGMSGKRFNRQEEEMMQKASFNIAETAASTGQNLLIDNTNLNENTRNRWKGLAQRLKMQYTELDLNKHVSVCVSRDSYRMGEEYVGRAVIERMALWAGLIKFDPSERLVLVDMDGTLADGSHRSPFVDDVLDDKPRYPIISLVRGFAALGYTIIIVSGRQISAGKNTVAWLERHNILYKHIFMRQTGDSRKDNIMKQEVLDRLPKDQICYVIDDRNQVVKMWRDNGLTCLQVAEGDF